MRRCTVVLSHIDDNINLVTLEMEMFPVYIFLVVSKIIGMNGIRKFQPPRSSGNLNE